MRSALTGALLVAALACGGGRRATPVAPSAVDLGVGPGTVLTVVSGEDDHPIAEADVTVAGQRYRSDVAGQIRLSQRADPDSLVDVVAPGILDRQTLLRPGSTRFALWPRTSATGLNENFTAVLVYTSAGGAAATTGGIPLLRLPAGVTQVVIVPSAAILDDERALAAHVDAAYRLTTATGGRITYQLANSRPASGVVFESRIDPAEETCVQGFRGFVTYDTRRGEITGGRIVLCSEDFARTGTVTHEMGHTFGLRHSPDPREVMYSSFSRIRAVDFGARESLAMALMLQRRAGNRFPDNDRDVTASDLSGTVTIACP